MKSALFSPLWAIVLAIGLVIVLAARVQAASPHSASTAIAGDLTTMMSAQHLDALAAQDPQHPDRFVAALRCGAMLGPAAAWAGQPVREGAITVLRKLARVLLAATPRVVAGRVGVAGATLTLAPGLALPSAAHGAGAGGRETVLRGDAHRLPPIHGAGTQRCRMRRR